MDISDKITEAELEVMEILWRNAQPVSFSDIRLELREKKDWEKSTIATLLRRLVDKGVISIKAKGKNHYFPNITREEYIIRKEEKLIDKLYEGSAKKLVATLCSRGELTEADIDELKLYFQMGDACE